MDIAQKSKISDEINLYFLIFIYKKKVFDFFTSKSRASRLAEVSNYKKCAAIGSRQEVLPIGAATKVHTASQLCSLSST